MVVCSWQGMAGAADADIVCSLGFSAVSALAG
jgi:hypothetical protein